MKKILKLTSMFMVIAMVISFSVPVMAVTVEDSTIDTLRTGTVDIYKYDISSAEKDGVWVDSYVSTGVRDEAGVESVLGSPDRVSHLNANGDAYGYAIKGVEFTYVKVADIRTYSEVEDGAGHTEILYGIVPNDANNLFLQVLGLTTEDRYKPADDDTHGIMTYYYRSDVLIDGLSAALNTNPTGVKNAMRSYLRTVGGTAMPLTDEYGHTSAEGLPLGLYLFVETRVPEMVTDTTAPFLVSVPMTSVDGANATDGGTRWIYDITLYPKNLTGIPTLEKTLREAKSDTGKNDGSQAITDGYAHTGTASDGDVVDYQIISTLPTITSEVTYLTQYTFVDTLSKGITYNKQDVVLEFFRDAECQDKICTWAEADGKFAVTYNTTEAGESVMTIEMTDTGLAEINTSKTVYSESNMVNSGYSDCTLRITYAATVNSDASVVYGDAGNPNDVVLAWGRTNKEYYDTLVDDCHVYVYGIDLTKQFSDGKGDYSKVEFVVQNQTDGYFLKAELSADEGVYYVTGHVVEEKDATHFVPTKDGKIIIKGVEDDTYIFTEIKTDNAYTKLKGNISVTVSTSEGGSLCDVYTGDSLGLLQNDPRYSSVEAGKYKNMPQRHLEHKPLTASAVVDKNAATMTPDGGSENAFVPFTVINTRGFDLPQTGGYGNWMFPVIGICGLAVAGALMYLLLRKKNVSE